MKNIVKSFLKDESTNKQHKQINIILNKNYTLYKSNYITSKMSLKIILWPKNTVQKIQHLQAHKFWNQGFTKMLDKGCELFLKRIYKRFGPNWIRDQYFVLFTGLVPRNYTCEIELPQPYKFCEEGFGTRQAKIVSNQQTAKLIGLYSLTYYIKLQSKF